MASSFSTLLHLLHNRRRSLLDSPASACSDVVLLPVADRCPFSLSHCHQDSLLNYTALHFCFLSRNTFLSLPSLSLLLLLHFLLLARSASRHFSPVVSRLSSRLRLSPSMAAVTLLALGNGAPDSFASLAALHAGHARTGLAAILSAGTFVSAFVVGVVAIHAAPFPIEPAAFVRDVFFYLIAASALFYVYLSGEIYLWQAVGLVGFYVFFVGFVFRMDSGGGTDGKGNEVEFGGEKRSLLALENLEAGNVGQYGEQGDDDDDIVKTGWWENLKKDSRS